MIYVDVTSSCKSPMNTGVQRVVRGLFRAMTASGLPVLPLAWEPRLKSYCTLSPRERGFLERPFGAAQTRNAHDEPGRRANPIPVWSKLWRQVRRSRSRCDLQARLTAADILFVPEIFQDNRIGWLSHLRSPARRMAIFHDAIAWRRPEITPPARQEGFLDYMNALASFDRVVAVSEEAAHDLQACWQGRSSKAAIEIAGWPVDDQFTKPAKERTTAGHPRKILCVGSFEPRKNHLKLLEAAQQLWQELGPVFEIILIGRTTAHFGERVQTEIRRLQKAGWKVDWRRHVDDQTLVAAYDESFFTVFPSLVEGFGLPIIESLRRGRPCLCGSNGALGEVAMSGGCLTVNQTDRGALAQGIRRLLTDNVLYERLAAEAHSRHFDTWEQYLAKNQALFLSSTAA